LNIYYAGENRQVRDKTKFLPLLCLTWLNSDNIVAAGQGCVPYLLAKRSQDWVIADKLEGNRVANVAATANIAANGNVSATGNVAATGSSK
jgi:hypothetical protein